MGTWGVGFYSGDYTSDVRSEYKDFLIDGKSPEEAVEAAWLLFQPDEDDEEGYLFWMVIADVQWTLGHLSEQTLEKALSALRSGEDELRWRGAPPAQQAKRRQTLEKLADRWNTPQPSPRKLRKPKGRKTSWAVGDLISLRFTGAARPKEELPPIYYKKYYLLHVVDVTKQCVNGRHAVFDELPVVFAYDWWGDAPPSPQTAVGKKCCAFISLFNIKKTTTF